MKELRVFLTILCLFQLLLSHHYISATEDDEKNEIAQHRSLERETEKKEVKKHIKKKGTKKRIPIQSQTGTVNSGSTASSSPKSPQSSASTITKTSTISYGTPGGSESVVFTVSVKAGVITSASSVNKAKDMESSWYQDAFGKKISALSVGKKVKGLNLSAVGGASLTTRAFNQFVTTSF